ncbi:hypothetical protein ACFV9D_15975 [Streptomyces sp. NPDC059875]|uniref:hypothetical protein n=1 Tax=unclassified Streptomyces TaxID=2593676 RepID=UPI00364CCFD4
MPSLFPIIALVAEESAAVTARGGAEAPPRDIRPTPVDRAPQRPLGAAHPEDGAPGVVIRSVRG